MRILTAPTENFIESERTVLADDAAAGSNVDLTLTNTAGFAQPDYVRVGEPGTERAEICAINEAVVDGDPVRVATLRFAHEAGEPVVRLSYNKRKFYGSLTKGGAYVELTDDGSPLDIKVDDPLGTTLEYDGAEGYAFFKATYYNSVELTETDLADSEAVAGDQSGRYATLWSIRNKAGFEENAGIGDDRVERARKSAEGRINGKLAARYSLPLAEVPADVGECCRLIAAAALLFEEYGGENAQAKEFMAEAYAMLNAWADGTSAIIGADGVELAQVSYGLASFRPNAQTAVDRDNPTAPTMRKNRKY